MDDKHSPPKVSKTVYEWFIEGVKKVFVDNIATTITNFIEWLIALKAAPLIFAGIIAFFAILLRWLQTPITIPAFIIPIVFVVYLLFRWVNRKYGRSIRNSWSKAKEKKLFDLVWRVNGKVVEGPLCPICGSPIVLPKQEFKIQAKNLADKIRGETTNRPFVYRCTSCDYNKELEYSHEKLIKIVYEALGIAN